MTTSERLVECQDCGYRWESTAESPRCAKAECGRSRNVEPVADDVDDEDAESDVEDDVDDDPDPDVDDDDQDDDGDSSGGYRAGFETVQTRTETETTQPDPELDRDDDRDRDDEQDDGDVQESTPQPEMDVDELPEIDPETLAPAIEATFGFAARSRGDHWRLEDPDPEDPDVDHEAMQLAKAYAPVLNHYAPYIFRQYTEVGAAIVVTFGIVGPRIQRDRELAEQQEKASEDTTESGTVREQETIEIEDEDRQELAPEIETEADNVGGYAAV